MERVEIEHYNRGNFMSTLFDQAPREYLRISTEKVDEFLSDAIALAIKHKVEVANVVAAKHVLELERRNDLYAANGDAFDEQLAGFGDILKDIHDALNDIAER
jgi:bifunctional DNase/RNase